jgi:CRP-like cAMP-binding protein
LWVLYKADLDVLATQYPVIGKALSDAISTRLSAENTNAELSRFREFALLAGLSEEDLSQIVPYFEPDRYRAGDQILRASTPPEKLFLIDQGQVRVQPFNGGSWILGPGQAFGERALLSNQPHNSTVFAETDVDVWTLSKPDFDMLLARYPGLAINISRMLSDRLDQQSASAGQPMAPDARYAPPQPGMPEGAQQRQQYATDPVGGEAPRQRGGFGQWYGNLSGRGKVLFALLILLIIWLIAVAAPSAVVSIMQGAGLVDADGTVASTNKAMQAVYKLGSYDVAALDSDMAQAVAMADNQILPTATYTPYPTATLVPTATPLPTNTPLPPTATPTPAPIAFIAAAPPVAPIVQEEAPEEPVQAASASPRIWDGRLDQLGIYIEDAQVSPGQPYWRLIEGQFWDEKESGGKHHIYVEVLDENRDRVVGHPVTVFWGDGSHTGNIEDKNPPDLGFNYQMYASGYAYSVKVEGLPSEIVKGAGMGDIENRFMGIHTSYLLTYKKEFK